MARHKVMVTVNGETEIVDISSNTTLLQMLRESLGLTGTKNGCAAGECGACTVIMNNEPVNSCLVLAVECNEAKITTIEGLAIDGRLNPVQESIIAHSGVQCGYCTPGVLIAAQALLERSPQPGDAQIREALVGNLCRCTGYLRLFEAVKQAAQKQ